MLFVDIVEIEPVAPQQTWNSHHARLPLPETAPPSRPNGLLSPERCLGAGTEGCAVGTVASFSGTGGPPWLRASRTPLASRFSLRRRSPRPICCASSVPSGANLWDLRAFSCTVLNFSSKSDQRMAESSRPLSRFGLS